MSSIFLFAKCDCVHLKDPPPFAARDHAAPTTLALYISSCRSLAPRERDLVVGSSRGVKAESTRRRRMCQDERKKG